jgi:anti-anti-sigma factor
MVDAAGGINVHSLNEDTTVPAPRTSDTAPWFDVRVSEAGTHAVTGELDMCTALILRAYLAKVVADTSDETPIVVDLSGVTLTDIVGLDPLMEARRQLAHANRLLILSGSPKRVTRLLRLLITSSAQRSLRRRGPLSRRRFLPTV